MTSDYRSGKGCGGRRRWKVYTRERLQALAPNSRGDELEIRGRWHRVVRVRVYSSPRSHHYEADDGAGMSWFTRLLGRPKGPGRETRESQPFTDAIVNAILEANTGAAASTTATAAVESAAGLLGRAFASAKVSPDNAITESLTPSVLNLIGRDHGEARRVAMGYRII